MSVDTLINWALDTGIDVSILIALVLVLRRPFMRIFGPRAAYALWLLPLIRFILPNMAVTIPRPHWMESWIETAPNLPSAIPMPQIFEAASTEVISAPFNWQALTIAIWLSGAALWLSWQMWQQFQYAKSVRANSAPASLKLEETQKKSAQILKLGHNIELRTATQNIGPLVTGIINPVIILPRDFEKNFSENQQYFALTHELAHLKRRDLWAAFAALIFRAINWPNPLVHLSASKFRADQEAACDAYVLKVMGGGSKTKQSYAATLIHSAKLTKNPKPNPLGQSLQTNPLCLTIYHPLKERLMTMKTSKTKTTLLPRIGVGAFLAASLALTAPITFASPHNSDSSQTKSKMKKVMKWVENNDGVETTKSYEITIEDGVTTAYSIDEHGNKTLVDASEIESFESPDTPGTMRVFMMGDGEHGKRSMRVFAGGPSSDIPMPPMPEGMLNGEHGTIVINRTLNGQEGMDMDGNVVFMSSGSHSMEIGSHASAMVNAAQELLSQVETTRDGYEISAKALRKLEKARKALAEAQKALEAEE